ncbi:MAG: indole-3-glycerol phosphate synthase TrpC [Thermoleophilia bacterium]
MSDFLKQILVSTREDLEVRRRTLPLADLKAAVLSRQPRTADVFREALATPGISVIAEVKRASPSKGDIRPELDVAAVVGAYETGGARAVSVLTEERFFKGSLDDLRQARAVTSLPIIRKDFVIDDYQVWEAAAAGADAVLLIVAALTPSELGHLLETAAAAGLASLVEVHTAADLAVALAAEASLVGINNRDLSSFKVSLQTTLDMIDSVPEGVVVVSESGIGGREDVVSLAAAGVDAVLIGEMLMRSADPATKLREITSI